LGRIPSRRTSRGRLPSAVLLPMQLEVGDRLADETGEYERISDPSRRASQEEKSQLVVAPREVVRDEHDESQADRDRDGSQPKRRPPQTAGELAGPGPRGHRRG